MVESKQLFGAGGQPTPGARRRQQFSLCGVQSHSSEAVRAFSTSSSTYGSGRLYDEYPPAFLASSFSAVSRASPASVASLSESRRQPFSSSASLPTLPTLGSTAFGFASTPSTTGRNKVTPDLGDSIFLDSPLPPPPAPGDDSRAPFKRYRNKQMEQINAYKRGF